MRIKFCGITNKEDADHAVNLGVDALGFIFHKDSPRCVTQDVVQEIVYFLPPFVTTVGVFVNLESDEVNDIMQTCRLDVAQLHGDESPEYCMQIKSRKIKAFRVSDQQDIKLIGRYQGVVSAALLDTKDEKHYGGTGKVFDWGLALEAQLYEMPLILSGGLSGENIVKAIRLVNPHGIDVSSGIECEPGKKDYQKMHDFISSVHSLE